MRATRKRTATFALAACLALLMFTFALPSSALAWDNCPKGLVNDPYPGACGRYVDTNGDDICDLSQSKPAAATTTTARATTTTAQATTTEAIKKEEQVTTTTTALVTTSSGEPPTGDCPLGPCANCGACLSIGASISASSVIAESDDEFGDDELGAGAIALAAADVSATTSTTIPPTDSGGTGDTALAGATQTASGPALFTHYNISPIAIAFFLIYAVSFALHKTKRIRLATHRKVWNVLLAATFLITGIFGLILTIQLDYQLPFKIPFDLLFWHVEAGVAMTLISLFHLSWHFNYYKNLFRSSRRKVREARQLEKVRDEGERRLAWEARMQKKVEVSPRRPSAHPSREMSPEL